MAIDPLASSYLIQLPDLKNIWTLLIFFLLFFFFIAVKKACPEASVQNGFIHELDQGYSYSCSSGYKAFDGKWWGVVTCNKGQWSYAPLCICK